jgi:hypothetical protein
MSVIKYLLDAFHVYFIQSIQQSYEEDNSLLTEAR